MKLPEVLGLIPCARMEVIPGGSGVSLVGLFQAMWFASFPVLHPFTIYAALHDGIGEGTIQLECMQLETEKTTYRYQRWFTLPGRQHVVNLEIPLKKCVFPKPGRYKFTLTFDAQEIAQRFLDIHQE